MIAIIISYLRFSKTLSDFILPGEMKDMIATIAIRKSDGIVATAVLDVEKSDSYFVVLGIC